MALFSTQISVRELVPMCRQLATGYEAGLPILRTLELVSRGARDKRAREVVGDIGAAIQKGATLGEAARAQRKYVPEFFVELLAAGERGGRLDIMLRDLADYYEDMLKMRRQLLGMIAYPAFIMVFAWFLGTFSLGIIRSLDLVKGTPFSFSVYLRQYLMFQAGAVGIFAAVFAVCVFLSRAGMLRWATGWIGNFVWPFRGVTRKFALARFFRSMALLIQSGMNIKHVITAAAATTANPYIQRDIMTALPWIAQGATLSQAFSGVRVLTPTAHEMLRVGEESGKLDFQLQKAAEYHFQEASLAAKVLMRVFYLAVYLGAASFVGYIVISFYARYLGQIDALMDIR